MKEWRLNCAAIVLVSKQTGTQWKVWPKKGYYVNTRAKHITELILKSGPRKSWWQRFLDWLPDPDVSNIQNRP